MDLPASFNIGKVAGMRPHIFTLESCWDAPAEVSYFPKSLKMFKKKWPKFRKSFEISQTDPLLYNEYGVLLYREGQYESAAQHFERALELAPTQMTSRWESLIVNMAQALRKVGRYDDAIAYFEYALSITPRAASTYSALAFTYQVKSRCTEPKALGLALSLIHI